MEGIITNTTTAPPNIIVYGQPGVGKTTLAAQAGALLIDCENGAKNVPGLSRTPYLQNWPEIRMWLDRIIAEKPKVKAIAIDTADWLIRRIVEHTLELDTASKTAGVTNTIGSAHGGYYKARDIVSNIIHRELFTKLNQINALGYPVIVLAHAVNQKLTTPEGFDISIATPDLPEWSGVLASFVEWSDAVLYACRDGDDRIVVTTGTNNITAKNRFGMPDTMPLAWSEIVKAIKANNGGQNNGKSD